MRKRKFSLFDHIARSDGAFDERDEVTIYKSLSLRQMGIEQGKFMEDPFAIVQFWYHRRKTFPQLYKIAMRVFATPASSCASERVFSILKKIVTPERSLLSQEHLSDIIVSRSLMNY